MKKVGIILSAIALGAVSLLPFNVSACTGSAKGEKTLGLAGGYATHNQGAFASVFFHYSFSNHVRIAPEIAYVFRSDDKSAFNINLNMQFPFRIARGLQVYPLVGFASNNWNQVGHGNSYRFGGNFGGGFDLYLTQYLKLNLEGKYSLMNKCSGAYVGLGIGYVF